MSFYLKSRRLAGRAIRSVPWLRRHWDASSDYRIITESEARGQRSEGWLSPLTARRQQRAYDRLLQQMHAGDARLDLRVAAEAVDAVGLTSARLLEVGCGSGYYVDVFAKLAKTRIDYLGIDYSPAMVESARSRYPQSKFETGDATALKFAGKSFDIVFNGVSLMHIMDYRKAIAESARIAKSACIYHSVPVFADHPTVYLRKYAYGSPVVEIVFSRAELLSMFREYGLEMVQSWNSIDYDVSAVANSPSHAETFLCQVKAGA